MNIFIPNEKLKKTMTESGEINVLGHIWPFEDDVLRQYFGHYYKPKEQYGFISTSNSILNVYMKIRPAELCKSLMNPSNPNFFLKREILWNWLEEREAEGNIKLPFSSKDGRDGKPFDVAMEKYSGMANAQEILHTQKIGDK